MEEFKIFRLDLSNGRRVWYADKSEENAVTNYESEVGKKDDVNVDEACEEDIDAVIETENGLMSVEELGDDAEEHGVVATARRIM